MSSKKSAVLITGANGGIGKALCKEFSKEEYFIIASDKDEMDCTCDQYIQIDLEQLVKDEIFRTRTIKSIIKLLDGRNLSGLINNAAIQIISSAEDINIDDFQSSMNVNVIAPLILIKNLLSELKSAKGAIVNIGSIHTKLTKPGFISYASSKSALSGLSQSLAVDLGDSVRVNVIQPAATETEMLLDGFIDNKPGYESLKDYHPLKRLAYPEEIASAALFLVSDKSGFITGSTLSIDGGIGCRLHDPE